MLALVLVLVLQLRHGNRRASDTGQFRLGAHFPSFHCETAVHGRLWTYGIQDMLRKHGIQTGKHVCINPWVCECQRDAAASGGPHQVESALFFAVRRL